MKLKAFCNFLNINYTYPVQKEALLDRNMAAFIMEQFKLNSNPSNKKLVSGALSSQITEHAMMPMFDFMHEYPLAHKAYAVRILIFLVFCPDCLLQKWKTYLKANIYTPQQADVYSLLAFRTLLELPCTTHQVHFYRECVCGEGMS